LQHRSRVVASNANWSSGEVRWQRGCSSCEGGGKPGAAHHGARCTQQCAVAVAGGRRGQDLAMTTHDAQRRQQAASSRLHRRLYGPSTRPEHGRVHGPCTVVYGLCTRVHSPVHGRVCTQTVYTAAYVYGPCTWRVQGCVHGSYAVVETARVHSRVHGRVYCNGTVFVANTAKYTACMYTACVHGRTGRECGRVCTAVYTTMYTAVYKPCTRSCMYTAGVHGLYGPCTGRVH